MNYREIYNSFLNDLRLLEENNIKYNRKIETKLKEYKKKLDEMEKIERLYGKLDYYTTVDYIKSVKELRIKSIHNFNSLNRLSEEIEKLLVQPIQ